MSALGTTLLRADLRRATYGRGAGGDFAAAGRSAALGKTTTTRVFGER